MTRSILTTLSISCLVVAWVMGAQPALTATPSVPTPGFAVANLPTDWSALSKGILVAPPIANGNAVPVGYEVSAQIPTIDYSGTTGPGTYQFTWLSCPARGVPDNSCNTRSAGAKEKGNPSGGNSTITASPDDAMRYLRFQLTVTPSGTWDSARTVTTDPAKDILVISKVTQGAQPEIPKNQTPGTNGTARLAAWSIPSDSVLRIREVAAWACTSATAGQVREPGFDATAAGCTPAKVLTNISETADQREIQFQIPAEANGKYLLVQDTITVATGASSTLSWWVVRSAPTALQGTQSAPTPAPQTTVTVIAKKKATRGQPFLVALSVSPASVAGTASIRIVPIKGSSRPTSLGRVAITTGTGLLERRLPASLLVGSYRVVVDFVPASPPTTTVTGSSTVAIK